MEIEGIVERFLLPSTLEGGGNSPPLQRIRVHTELESFSLIDGT